MIQQPKSASQYQREMLAALAQIGVRQTSPGGKARALVDIIGNKVGELEARQFVAQTQTLVPYATGDSLDALGAIYGVTRIPRRDAVISPSDSNFKFYVRRGTFGDINGGLDIVIPAGTRVFTDSTSGPVYLVTYTVTLAAGDSEGSFGASALQTGEAANAPAGSFTRHNFTNYADSAFGSLLVTNDFGVIAGRDEEDDESYRYRINLKLQSSGGAGEVDLRAAVLQLPGVQDVVFKPLAGTFLAYIYGISPSVPQSLVQQVQSQIDDKSAYPIRGTAVVPDLVGISLTTTISTTAGLSQSDKNAVAAAGARAAADYINNLNVGQTLVINEISDRIRNADPRILDVGEPNKPLEEIFIWRSRLDDTRYSRFLVNNYTPVVGERILVETSISNAINLITT